MNKHKMKTTPLLLIIVLVMMGISWVLVDVKGFDQESSPQHQKIKTVLLAWIDAIEKGDIPIAASLCVVEPTREHDLFISLADTSSNMRLRNAALQKYGPQGSSGGWLYQGDTAQEIREIFANIQIVIDGDIATLKEQDKDIAALKRVGNDWKIAPSDAELMSDMNQLKIVGAKNLTANDILAGKLDTLKKAQDQFSTHFALMESALGSLSHSRPGCLRSASLNEAGMSTEY